MRKAAAARYAGLRAMFRSSRAALTCPGLHTFARYAGFAAKHSAYMAARTYLRHGSARRWSPHAIQDGNRMETSDRPKDHFRPWPALDRIVLDTPSVAAYAGFAT